MLQGIPVQLNQSSAHHASILNPNPNASASASPELLLLQNEKVLTHFAQRLNMSSAELSNLLRSPHLDSNGSTLTTMTTSMDGFGPYVETSESSALLIVLTVCYALIFVAGVLGNLITCIVIARNNFMHTATNFYLFNLAVSDLILLISGIPQELYNLWCPDSYPFTDSVCILESVLSEMAANATVLTITAFTVERYIAICHPFRQHTMSKLSRAIKFIFAIWVAAFLLALPQAMQFSVLKQDVGYSCTMENNFYAHVFAVSGFIFFCGPMTAICVLYVLIGMKLKRSRLLQALPRRAYDANRGLNAQSRVIRMLVAVAVAFFLCWAPFHAQRLMAVYGVSLINVCRCAESFNDYFRILDYTSGVLYFLSTCINPLLYNIMSHKFREAFKITLTRQFGLARSQQRSQYQHQHNYSALMRLHGSMRLQPASCSVNNNALEPYGSYRVVQFRCRDGSHQLSQQDSIRTNTTTTTTTINSSSQAGVTAGTGHRGRSRKQQELVGMSGVVAGTHRMLQAQVSHAMLDNAKRHTLLATNNGALLLSPAAAVAAESAAETQIQQQQQQPVTRLKLSRIISRRDEPLAASSTYSGSYSLPEQELCHSSDATSSATAAAAEVRRLPWRKKRQKRNEKGAGAGRQGNATPKSL